MLMGGSPAEKLTTCKRSENRGEGGGVRGKIMVGWRRTLGSGLNGKNTFEGIL